MKSKVITATAIALALSSAGAFAQTAQNRLEGEAANAVRFEQTASNVSRAEVRAQYLQARKDGALPLNAEASYVVTPSAATTVSRAAVRAQAAGWARAHQIEGQSAS